MLTYFQGQLSMLMKMLNKSIPSYIRCIKPNDEKKPKCFNSLDVMRQMRQAGLLEAIRIRKAGYEIRVKHEDFVKKYRLMQQEYQPQGFQTSIRLLFYHALESWKQDSEQLIALWEQNPKYAERIQKTQFQVGKTKMFMKIELRNYLDQKIIECKMASILRIQKWAKVAVFQRTIVVNLKKLTRKIRMVKDSLRKYISARRLSLQLHRVATLAKIVRIYRVKHKDRMEEALKNWKSLPKKVKL